jgi:hypothetical protein
VGWITPQPFSSGVSSALFFHVAPCGDNKRRVARTHVNGPLSLSL